MARYLSIDMLVDSPPAEAKVAGIILAAGASRRMGSVNKLLASIAGKPLVRHAVESFVATSLSPIIVVVGYESDKVAGALEGLPVQLVFNPDHATGQGSSVGVGVEALDNNVTDAMIGLGDMPLLSSELLDSLIHTHIGREEHACNITIPAFEGQRGNPVLWGKTFFPELITLAGDRGGRQLLNDHKAAQHLIACDHSSVLRDVDTVDALAAIVSEAEKDLQ